MKFKDRIKRKRFWLLTIGAIFLIWFSFCLPNPLFNDGYSTVLLSKNGELLSARISNDQQWRFPEGDSVPYKFATCIRYFEDEYFYKHPGVNPVSLFRALKQNMSSSKVVSGGSTITMQVIRMALQHNNRSFMNKIHEMFLAVRLELRCSKNEILQLYASHAPFGGNVVGLEAAAWRYYNRPAYKLSWGESAALAVLPNAPALVHPGRNRNTLLLKRNTLLNKLWEKGEIDSVTCELAKEEPLPGEPIALPNYGQHLIDKAIKDGFEEQIIHSTIDYQKQKYIAGVAKQHVIKNKSNFISNIGIIVLNTQTGEVISYIGNVSLPGLDNNSYVDVAQAKRSSGSILKPILFASMLTEGILLPDMIEPDVPTVISGYKPENFEKKYMGAVPASQALAYSLNIPAVRMLQDYGIEKFHSQLQHVGLTTITQHPDYYGLALILGGAETTLWDITSAYASMARSLEFYTRNSAQYNKLDYRHANYIATQTDTVLQEYSFLHAGALWATFEAISTLHRPWVEAGWERFASARKIAWKTGTSFGHRDAWCVGVTPEYTVGVWVGNATGEGRPGLTGLNYASPVMFEIFKYLQPKTWFEVPYDDLVEIDICKKSGCRAGEYCESEKRLVPAKSVRADVCSYHKKVFLDKERKHRVLSSCYTFTDMVDTVYFVLPPAMEWFYKMYTYDYTPLPPFLEGCSQANETLIEVIHPSRNTKLIMPKSGTNEVPKYVFEAVHRNKNMHLYWHVDNDFIGETIGYHKIEYTPSIGKHVLFIIDEAGNSVQVPFEVTE